MDEVFNDYNINILFTVNSLPCKVSMASIGGFQGAQYGNDAERMAAMNQAAKTQFTAQTSGNETAGLQKAIAKAAFQDQQAIKDKKAMSASINEEEE